MLSLPYEIRYRLAWDGDLVSAVLAVFLRVVYGFYQRPSKGGGLHETGACTSATPEPEPDSLPGYVRTPFILPIRTGELVTCERTLRMTAR